MCLGADHGLSAFEGTVSERLLLRTLLSRLSLFEESVQVCVPHSGPAAVEANGSLGGVRDGKLSSK